MGGKASCCRNKHHAPIEPQPRSHADNTRMIPTEFDARDRTSHMCAEYHYLQQNNYSATQAAASKFEYNVDGRRRRMKENPMPPNSPDGPPVHYLDNGLQQDRQKEFVRADPQQVQPFHGGGTDQVVSSPLRDNNTKLGDDAVVVFDPQNYPFPSTNEIDEVIPLSNTHLTQADTWSTESSLHDNDGSKPLLRDDTGITMPE